MKCLAPVLAGLMLGACAANAQSQQTGAQGASGMAHHEPHILRHDSAADFETTLANARAAVDARGFKTFAVIDHAAGAASIGEALPATTLIIFGNPKGGTPVMQAEQAMGLELPLKMLVAESNDGVTLVWRDMAHSFREYGISDHPAADKMNAALKAIAEEAGRGE